jgi:hypothetical protein
VLATLVLIANGSSKPIEDVEVGDVALATDPQTGETTGKPATAVSQGSGLKRLADVTVEGDSDGPLTATDGHPFWVEGEGWLDANDLQARDLLRQADADLAAGAPSASTTSRQPHRGPRPDGKSHP